MNAILGEEPYRLDQRNPDGKTPIMMAIEHDRESNFRICLGKGPDLKITEVTGGNNALHIACKKMNSQAAYLIFEKSPELSLMQNYEGDTPFHVAVRGGSLEVLKSMGSQKSKALKIKNAEGENPLFLAARSGNTELFMWFSGSLDFFLARGERNFKG